MGKPLIDKYQDKIKELEAQIEKCGCNKEKKSWFGKTKKKK